MDHIIERLLSFLMATLLVVSIVLVGSATISILNPELAMNLDGYRTSPTGEFECAVILYPTEEIDYIDGVYSFKTGKTGSNYYLKLKMTDGDNIEMYSKEEISFSCFTD